MGFLHLFSQVVSLLITLVLNAMFLRAILPFFMDVEESRFYYFLTCVTEPFIIPIREILWRLDIGQDSPFDMGFFLTYFILMLADWMLPTV